MKRRCPQLGESLEEAGTYSEQEVNMLVNNLRAMKLPEGDMLLELLKQTPFHKLDKLFNGAPN